LRPRTAFRAGFVVLRLVAIALALPVAALLTVLFVFRVLAGFVFTPFDLAADGATVVPSSSDAAAAGAALRARANRGSVFVFFGCHVWGELIRLCLRNSRAASSWVRRPRCVYIPGFTLFCLLIHGT
jgi:hypothetical protein